MPTPDQKADVRPISFTLQNQGGGGTISMDLVIRPEDLNRTEPSRLSTIQTLGGAWADNFGRGIGTVTIAGHTGWGQGGRPNGLGVFLALHDLVYTRWHAARAAAVDAGRDPDSVKLIFADALDEFVWVVAPQVFTLRRNKSRPLLSQYNIVLTWLADRA